MSNFPLLMGAAVGTFGRQVDSMVKWNVHQDLQSTYVPGGLAVGQVELKARSVLHVKWSGRKEARIKH